MCLEIVSRSMWNAIPAKMDDWFKDLYLPVNSIYLTYSNTRECDKLYTCKNLLKLLQDKAMRIKQLGDIYYSFMVGGDGRVYEGRGFETAPCLPTRYHRFSSRSIYIAYLGNFDEKRPTEKMRTARYQLIQYGIANDLIQPDYRKVDIVLREKGSLPRMTIGNPRSRDRNIF